MPILTCQNPSCPSPHWERPAQKGRVPNYCPPCKESMTTAPVSKEPRPPKESSAEPVDSGPKIQNLVCQNAECAEPNWTRLSQQGKLPKYCPTCKPLFVTKIDKPEIETLDLSMYASDEEAFMAQIPSEGNIGNTYLQARLGWDDEKYSRVKQSLLDEQKIHGAVGGRTGALRLFTSDDVEVEEGPKFQTLTCKECKTEWTRPAARGVPSLCPDCKAVSLVEEEPDENEYKPDVAEPKSFDPVIFSSKDQAEIELVMGQLRKRYPKTTFYVQEKEELAIMIKRAYPVAVSPEILDTVRTFAVTASLPAD